MRTRLAAVLTMVGMIALGTTVPASAQAPGPAPAPAATPAPAGATPAQPVLDASFRADIETMMQLSGADRIGKQVAQYVSGAIIQSLKQQNPSVPQEAIDIARDTAEAELASAFSGPDSIVAQTEPIYAKYFTHDEIKQMITFYQGPLGKKMIEVMPSLMQEGMQIGQQWAVAHGPHVKEAIDAKLKAKGYLK